MPPRPVAPPLPKPNFSVSNVAAPNPSAAPAPRVASAPSPAPAPAKPGLPAQSQQPPQPQQPPRVPVQPPRPPMPPKPMATPAAPGQMPPLKATPQSAPAPAPAPAPRPEGMPPASSIRQAPRVPGAPSGPGQLPPRPAAPGQMPPAKGAIPSAPLVAKPILSDPKSANGQTPSGAKPAEVKKSVLRFLPIVLLLLVVLGVAWFLISKVLAPKTPVATTPTTTKTTAKTQTVITYWGLWESTPVLQETLAQFESQNPGIKVNYQQQTYRDYRERLQAAIAGGKGPDVFRYHASWVPMLRSELSEMPATVYSAAEYSSTFFPIANQQLQSNGKYVGVPLMYEGLALIYNKEIFNTANAQPPKTWAELRDLAVRLTIRDGRQIRRAGVAIGNAANVDNFSDILGLLMLQNGANPADPTSPKAQEAIQFYTDFYTKSKVWDSSLPNSTVAFARGDVAMILAPSWRIHEIKTQNPNLTIGVAPVPQLGSSKITWASYWAEGVSAQSKNKEASWKLLKYLSSAEALQKLHSDASKERNFGELYPRVDMANMLSDSPYAAAYLSDAPYAKNWYLNSFTHDNGVNDQIIKYYEDALTSLANETGGASASLTTVAQGLLQILRQYNLTK